MPEPNRNDLTSEEYRRFERISWRGKPITELTRRELLEALERAYINAAADWHRQ